MDFRKNSRVPGELYTLVKLRPGGGGDKHGLQTPLKPLLEPKLQNQGCVDSSIVIITG